MSRPGHTGPAAAKVDAGELSASDFEALGTALRLAVGRLSRQLRRHAVGGLTPAQYSALVTLDRCGPARPSELAEAEGVSAPTLSRIVGGLERHGYLTRAGDPSDGRSSLLAIAAPGQQALHDVRRERTALLARSIAALGDEERRLLTRALPALERLVEETRRQAREPVARV